MNDKTRVVLLLALTFSFNTAAYAAGTQPPVLSDYLRNAVRPPSTYVDNYALAATVAKTVTVPRFALSDYVFLTALVQAKVVAIFSSTCADYYIRVGGTAVTPTTDVADGTGSERNPSALRFNQLDTFSVISPVDCKLTVSYYLGTGAF